MINIAFYVTVTPGPTARVSGSLHQLSKHASDWWLLRQKDNLTACDYFGNDFEHVPVRPSGLPVTDSDSLQGTSSQLGLATWMRDNEKYWKTMWNMMWNITQIISWKTSRNILRNIIKFIGNKIILYFRKTNWPILCETLWNIHKNIDQSISWNKHVKQHEISTNKSWNKTWNIYAQLNDKHLVK